MTIDSLVAYMDELRAKQAKQPARRQCPRHTFNDDGLTCKILLEDVAYYGQWINRTVTLYRAQDDGRLVGCELVFTGDEFAKATKQ